ncbi:uncharacterized protein HVO_0385A [Haloferax volcanii DS2]|uniref:Uncharacterized protein n=1 Tax=Haloferax volcanii (strain ATCC 29605 / DSM 3757 / JCM 8879 / NBRC 14742 / NCIMB 2012 / VKM B-1768 / DS2) TaxID=309800 RepID=A0A1C9J6T5_HALVD|nr:uncharacterized protein HVO_0385A [Haloferax volcanii DS2]
MDVPPKDFMLGRSSAWSSRSVLVIVSFPSIGFAAVVSRFLGISSPNSIVELLYFISTYCTLLAISMFSSYFAAYQLGIGRQ